MILNKIAFDSSRPIIARAAGRALIGSLNFSISSLIQQHLRNARFGVAMPEAGGVDALNDTMADDAAAAEAARVRAEQGFTLSTDPLELAASLKVIRDSVDDDLRKNAAQRAMLSDPSKTMPDTFHIGATFGESLDFQLRLMPRVSDAQCRAEAKALNVTEADIKAAVVARHNRQLNYLKENRADIEKIYGELVAKDGQGHQLGIDDAETAFERLPAMVKLRIAAAADKGLHSARSREIERHMSGNQEAKGNLGLIDGTRREILAEVGRWLENPKFKGEVDEAVSRGSNMPQFAPAPHVQAPDEVEEARRKVA